MYGWEIAEQFKKLFLVGIMVRVANDTIVQVRARLPVRVRVRARVRVRVRVRVRG
jgi:hypothetical protein